MHALSKDPTEQVEPITGIYFHPFTDSTEFKYYVVATTAKRIYQFVGVVTKGKSPVFQDLFVFYEPEKGNSCHTSYHTHTTPHTTPTPHPPLVARVVLRFGNLSPCKALVRIGHVQSFCSII